MEGIVIENMESSLPTGSAHCGIFRSATVKIGSVP
jgi:hypothetical protein